MTGIKIRWKARHTVLTVLSIVWIVSYMDRTVMSVALPYIAKDFHLSSWESGLVMGAFFAGYSLFQIPGGMLSDKFGIRKVASLAMLWWSIFTAITGTAANLTQMLVIRFVFGLGEGLYPACSFKGIAVWFPKAERATANAIQFAAGSLGTAIGPLVVIAIMSYWGWRPVFYVLLLPGMLGSLLFWIFVRNRPSESRRVTAPELAEIEDGPDGEDNVSGAKVGLRAVLAEPAIVSYFLMLFTFDIGYWGITTWLPTYLVSARGFSMIQMGWAAALPNFVGIIASLLGGWMSDRYFSTSRKWPILASQLTSALLLYFSFMTTSASMVVLYQALAGFTLNFFFTAFWALPMNTVPKSMMAVASGFINMAGQIAAFVAPVLIGFLVQASGGGFGAAFALLIVSLLASAVILCFAKDGSRARPIAQAIP